MHTCHLNNEWNICCWLDGHRWSNFFEDTIIRVWCYEEGCLCCAVYVFWKLVEKLLVVGSMYIHYYCPYLEISTYTKVIKPTQDRHTMIVCHEIEQFTSKPQNKPVMVVGKFAMAWGQTTCMSYGKLWTHLPFIEYWDMNIDWT